MLRPQGLGAAHASLHQAHGDDRRLRRRRLGRRRFGHLWRAARARQHPRRRASSPARTTPRVLELRGDAAQKINRAYGTTGIITSLEMPLAPAWPWVEVIVAFDDFFDAFQVGHEAALADGIVKKLMTPIIWPIPSYFRDIREHCPDGKSILIAMIAEPSLESFKNLLAGRGTITLERPFDESPGNGAALRVHLEPHDAAASESRSHRHLSAVPVPARSAARMRARRCTTCSATKCCITSSSSASADGLTAARCRSCATPRPSA